MFFIGFCGLLPATDNAPPPLILAVDGGPGVTAGEVFLLLFTEPAVYNEFDEKLLVLDGRLL